MYWDLAGPVRFLSAACFLQVAAVGFPVAGLTEVVGEAFAGAVAVVWAKAAEVPKSAVRARAQKSFIVVLIWMGMGCGRSADHVSPAPIARN
jgi:hypothetical protein